VAVVALIGGTGADFFPSGEAAETLPTSARWGEVPGPLQRWQQHGHDVLFVARHGELGRIPPHRVNYRANIFALSEFEPDYVIALNAVGGIAPLAEPGMLVIPDQLIDYTWGRQHSYQGESESDKDILFTEFTIPYDESLRKLLIDAAALAELNLLQPATYGATQGPRLETAAEIDRLERDGCCIVGMTGMPEAALARELGLRYASCSLVVNRAAGRGDSAIHAEISTHLKNGMGKAAALIDSLLAGLR
jgi:5'-methylthioinosine phosphorylase